MGVQEEQRSAATREKERDGEGERLSSGDGRRAKEDTKEDFERPTTCVRASERAVHGLRITPH